MKHYPTTATHSQTQNRAVFRNSKYFWPVIISSVILGLLLISAALLVPRALTAKNSLEASMPLATEIKDEILDGDTAGAKATMQRLAKLSNEADVATNFFLWRAFEVAPLLGENLRAVRIVSSSVAALSNDVLMPVSEINLTEIKRDDGSFDIEKIRSLEHVLQSADKISTQTHEQLTSLNQGVLLPQVADGVEKLDGVMTELSNVAAPAAEVLKVLPSMLGGDGARNYLLLFQNSAEIRSGGGNPASLSLLKVDNGRIEITQQASSTDFTRQGFSVAAETAALYDPRVGFFMQDTNYTPQFTESADLMRSFWLQRFGSPIDGVIALDPVALSYLIEATGPIKLPTGDVLTAENTVPLLLNEVYFRYPNPADQDIFFAAAARSIFDALSTGEINLSALVSAIERINAEGRLMYFSSNEEEMKLIENTRFAGPLPTSNKPETVVGVFFNQLKATKIDYYMDSAVQADSNVCAVEKNEPIEFNIAVELKNNLTPAQAAGLPDYLMGSNGGGAIYRDVMVYGPVGSEVAAVTIDGAIVQPHERWGNNYRVLPDKGRPVLQVPVLVDPQSSAVVKVAFLASKSQSNKDFGPFTVHVGPTVRTTPVTVDAPGCK